ncbi:Ribonuclease R [Nymphon striatum]|nr:Ribonuclease R [Nymphon striatum]
MLDVMDKAGHPVGFNELAEILGVTEQQDLDAMKFRLRAMERDGQILFNRGKKYVPTSKADLIAGTRSRTSLMLRSHDLPHVWPEGVKTETDKLSDEVAEEDKKGRVDLRKMPLVTIDGEDSRDFDDAATGFLPLLIADVSHYVRPGTELDKEAIERATSVYFPAEVIPMLPEKISNGLCSLNPKVDRLCMVCEATIDAQGEVTDYRFYNAVMHSAARLTYKKMAAMVVDHDADLRQEHAPIIDHLDDLYKLYKVLRKARDDRGSIDFETTETQIIFGENRKIENIIPTARNDASLRSSKSVWLPANMCAARFLERRTRFPALHRVHSGPETEKLAKVHEFLNGLGLKLGGGDDPQPKDYAALLSSVSDRPDARLIQTVMLRSMSRAQYAPEDKENPESTRHFGLARKDYAHFTSPIRRYPDLLVHRAILHILENKTAKGYTYDYQQMKNLGEHCSQCEQRADDASRDVMSWLKAEYMQDKIGETFKGIISTVTSFGLFVELDDVFVEGLVHVSALKSDYYHFDAARHTMTGENSGKTFRLGDSIEILVARVDLDDRKIDFVLPDSGEDDQGFRKPRKKKSGDSYSKKTKNTDKKIDKKTGKKKKKTLPKKVKKSKKKAKLASKRKGKD